MVSVTRQGSDGHLRLAWLVEIPWLVEYRTTVWEVVGSNPGQTDHERTQWKSTVSTTSRRDLILVVP